MWAEQQLASARMAVEAQLEIDREQQRRRVLEETRPAVTARSERVPPPALEDVYLPIAAEAEAASLSAPELPAVVDDKTVEQSGGEGRSLIPTIPDVTRTAVRWIRPLVPPIIASAIDTTTKPFRGVRQIFEETEEIHISMRRTHRVSTQMEETEDVAQEHVPDAGAGSRKATLHRDEHSTAMTSGMGQAGLTGGSTRELRGPRRELPPGR